MKVQEAIALALPERRILMCHEGGLFQAVAPVGFDDVDPYCAVFALPDPWRYSSNWTVGDKCPLPEVSKVDWKVEVRGFFTPKIGAHYVVVSIDRTNNIVGFMSEEEARMSKALPPPDDEDVLQRAGAIFEKYSTHFGATPDDARLFKSGVSACGEMIKQLRSVRGRNSAWRQTP